MKIFKTCLLTAVFSVLMTCMAFAASDKNRSQRYFPF